MALNDATCLKHNMTARFPIGIMRSWTVDQYGQGRGLGVALYKTLERTRTQAGSLGIRGLLVNALSESCKSI